VSGNPNGRPKGLQDKRTELRGLLAPHAKDLINQALELAKDGDSSALRLCMARIVPPVRAKEEAVELGQVTGTLSERGQAIANAGFTGKITPNHHQLLCNQHQPLFRP
jgi:hypothetical protein